MTEARQAVEATAKMLIGVGCGCFEENAERCSYGPLRMGEACRRQELAIAAALLAEREKALREAAGVCTNHSIQMSREAAKFRGGSNPHHSRLHDSSLHAKDASSILSLIPTELT